MDDPVEQDMPAFEASQPETRRVLQRLEAVFARCFEAAYQTVLEGGGAEPLYIVAADVSIGPHRVVYRDDHVASALHEVAHWCLAGAARRQREDYGYWYEPDGRDAEQQRAFEKVEARPQALEWIFSEACQVGFALSADNLGRDSGPSAAFAAAVHEEKWTFQRVGLPPRAARFKRALEQAGPDRCAAIAAAAGSGS